MLLGVYINRRGESQIARRMGTRAVSLRGEVAEQRELYPLLELSMVTHRLSTIRAADRIVVLEQGRIAECGAYEELIGKGGLFTELARRQMA